MCRVVCEYAVMAWRVDVIRYMMMVHGFYNIEIFLRVLCCTYVQFCCMVCNSGFVFSFDVSSFETSLAVCVKVVLRLLTGPGRRVKSKLACVRQSWMVSVHPYIALLVDKSSSVSQGVAPLRVHHTSSRQPDGGRVYLVGFELLTAVITKSTVFWWAGIAQSV
jgi:hypothetical protein